MIYSRQDMDVFTMNFSMLKEMSALKNIVVIFRGETFSKSHGFYDDNDRKKRAERLAQAIRGGRSGVRIVAKDSRGNWVLEL